MTLADPAVSDTTLVARVAAGDEAALGMLYDRHGNLAWSLARSILSDAAEAEEAVSDAFLQVWNRSATFDPGRSSVEGWLCMIVRTRALDRLRARKRRHAAVDRSAAADTQGFAAPIADAAVTPDAAIDTADRGRAVRAALDSLPAPQRRALEMAYFGGLSHSEIAQALNEPVGTVKTRIRSGMEKLRTLLAAYVGVG